MSTPLVLVAVAWFGLCTVLPLRGSRSDRTPASELAQEDGPEAKARAILAELERGIGTPAERAKARNVVVRGKLQMPGMKVSGTFEETYAESARARLAVHWPGYSEAATSGCAVDERGPWSWTTDPAFGVYVADGEQGGGFLRQLAISRRAAWDSMYRSATLVGSARIGERDCDELEMQPRSSGDKPVPSERWFVTRDGRELARVDLVLPNPTGGTLPMTFLFEDWRRVDGVAYAFKKTQKVGEVQLTFATETIEHPSELDAGAVEPPAQVLEARKDPKKRAAGVGDDPSACSIVDVAAQPCATVRKTIQAADVAREIATSLPQVGKYLTRVGVDPVGPPFSRYHAMQDGKIDFECGIPIKKAVTGEGDVLGSALPGGKAAMTWHVGSYHDLSQAHERLRAWIEANHHVPSGGPWEIYWTDPGIEPDPTKWKTQIYWPLE